MSENLSFFISSIHSTVLPWIFHYVGNIVRNLQKRYDGITRKSTAGCIIAEGDFLIFQSPMNVILDFASGRFAFFARPVHFAVFQLDASSAARKS